MFRPLPPKLRTFGVDYYRSFKAQKMVFGPALLVTKLLTVAIDFHSIFFHTMEVNGYSQLFGCQHSSNIIFVFNSWNKAIQVFISWLKWLQQSEFKILERVVSPAHTGCQIEDTQQVRAQWNAATLICLWSQGFLDGYWGFLGRVEYVISEPVHLLVSVAVMHCVFHQLATQGVEIGFPIG